MLKKNLSLFRFCWNVVIWVYSLIASAAFINHEEIMDRLSGKTLNGFVVIDRDDFSQIRSSNIYCNQKEIVIPIELKIRNSFVRKLPLGLGNSTWKVFLDKNLNPLDVHFRDQAIKKIFLPNNIEVNTEGKVEITILHNQILMRFFSSKDDDYEFCSVCFPIGAYLMNGIFSSEPSYQAFNLNQGFSVVSISPVYNESSMMYGMKNISLWVNDD